MIQTGNTVRSTSLQGTLTQCSQLLFSSEPEHFLCVRVCAGKLMSSSQGEFLQRDAENAKEEEGDGGRKRERQRGRESAKNRGNERMCSFMTLPSELWVEKGQRKNNMCRRGLVKQTHRPGHWTRTHMHPTPDIDKHDSCIQHEPSH